VNVNLKEGKSEGRFPAFGSHPGLEVRGEGQLTWTKPVHWKKGAKEEELPHQTAT